MGYKKAPESTRKLQFLLGLVLLILFLFILCFYGGRPEEPHYFEVDVTDRMAEFSQNASAGSQNLSGGAPDSLDPNAVTHNGQAAAEGFQ